MLLHKTQITIYNIHNNMEADKLHPFQISCGQNWVVVFSMINLWQ